MFCYLPRWNFPDLQRRNSLRKLQIKTNHYAPLIISAQLRVNVTMRSHLAGPASGSMNVHGAGRIRTRAIDTKSQSALIKFLVGSDSLVQGRFGSYLHLVGHLNYQVLFYKILQMMTKCILQLIVQFNPQNFLFLHSSQML